MALRLPEVVICLLVVHLKIFTSISVSPKNVILFLGKSSGQLPNLDRSQHSIGFGDPMYFDFPVDKMVCGCLMKKPDNWPYFHTPIECTKCKIMLDNRIQELLTWSVKANKTTGFIRMNSVLNTHKALKEIGPSYDVSGRRKRSKSPESSVFSDEDPFVNLEDLLDLLDEFFPMLNSVPSLEHMVRLTLGEAKHDQRNGFILVVEGGKIPGGEHLSQDAENMELDRAVNAVLKETNKDDTLIIVTGACGQDGVDSPYIPLFATGPGAEAFHKAAYIWEVPILIQSLFRGYKTAADNIPLQLPETRPIVAPPSSNNEEKLDSFSSPYHTSPKRDVFRIQSLPARKIRGVVLPSKPISSNLELNDEDSSFLQVRRSSGKNAYNPYSHYTENSPYLKQMIKLNFGRKHADLENAFKNVVRSLPVKRNQSDLVNNSLPGPNVSHLPHTSGVNFSQGNISLPIQLTEAQNNSTQLKFNSTDVNEISKYIPVTTVLPQLKTIPLNASDPKAISESTQKSSSYLVETTVLPQLKMTQSIPLNASDPKAIPESTQKSKTEKVPKNLNDAINQKDILNSEFLNNFFEEFLNPSQLLLEKKQSDNASRNVGDKKQGTSPAHNKTEIKNSTLNNLTQEMLVKRNNSNVSVEHPPVQFQHNTIPNITNFGIISLNDLETKILKSLPMDMLKFAKDLSGEKDNSVNTSLSQSNVSTSDMNVLNASASSGFNKSSKTVPDQRTESQISKIKAGNSSYIDVKDNFLAQMLNSTIAFDAKPSKVNMSMDKSDAMNNKTHLTRSVPVNKTSEIAPRQNEDKKKGAAKGDSKNASSEKDLIEIKSLPIIRKLLAESLGEPMSAASRSIGSLIQPAIPSAKTAGNNVPSKDEHQNRLV